jgi:NADPH:quinone reductase-like Zn-dependent oxidoreductase
MKAMIAARYGGPETMQLQDVPTPTIGDGEVLVAIRATSLQALDWHLLQADPAIVRLGEGLFRPKRTVHGVDIAGVVEAVGADVDDLEPGDEVFGWSDHGGGLAEYIALPQDHVRPRPHNVTLEEAATVGVAAFTALQMVRNKAHVAERDRVLVVGASSGVGHFAVQLCKAAGAHVTGVSSTRNLDLVRAVGADDVIDRYVDDWSAMDRTWDVILQVTGNIPYARARKALAPGGRYVMAGVNADGRILGPMLPFLRLMVRSRFDRRARTVRAVENADDLRTLAELVEAGSLRPAIDRRFTLAEAADAMRFVEEGCAAGKIVVTVPSGSRA